MTDPEVPVKVKRVVERSARYPYYSLKESVAFADMVKNVGGRKEAPISTILKEMDVKDVTNKRYSYTISSAEQFGIIERTENGIKLTEKAVGILYPMNEEQKSGIIKQCFSRPSLYKTLISQYDGLNLPNPEALRNVFIHYGIAENVVDQAVSSFIDSAKYANLLKDNKLIVEEKNSTQTDQKKDGEQAQCGTQNADQTAVATEKTEPAIPAAPGYHKFEFFTSSGKKAVIQIPIECTKNDLSKLKALLDVLGGGSDE